MSTDSHVRLITGPMPPVEATGLHGRRNARPGWKSIRGALICMAFTVGFWFGQPLLTILFRYDKEVVMMKPTTNPCVSLAITARPRTMAVVEGVGGIKSSQSMVARPAHGSCVFTREIR